MDHNSLIKAKAKEILVPAGFRQKGSSRLWYKREGWWSCVVEFQPSSFAKGSFLNVSACLHWFPRDHFSFDLGSREKPHTPAHLEFASAIEHYCRHALTIFDRMLGQISQDFAFAELAKTNDGHWKHYYMLCSSIMGDRKSDVPMIWERLSACSAQFDWQQQVIAQGRTLFEGDDRKALVQSLIAESLAKLKLT